ncbi:MAG: PRC-barrel domain-containing protein [Methylobacteriaceae bacterium]|nr:PRC-barrel domain-containing protein [Methylobacteriaceae bacterium]
MQFVTDQQQGQFRASKFMGLDVYGTDNQKIGDIKEILIDQTGNAKTAIIGVGGFLGIGEKNVGVQWSALEWRMEKPASTSSAANTTTSPGAGSSAGNRPGAGDVTGSTATSTSNAGAGNAGSNRSPAESAAANGYPDHAVLRVTRQDVERAPTFRYYGEQRSNADRGSNAGANTNPPRQ